MGQVGIAGNMFETYGGSGYFDAFALGPNARNLKTWSNFCDFNGAWYPWEGMWYDTRAGAADSYPVMATVPGRPGVLGHAITNVADAVGTAALTLNNFGWGVMFGGGVWTFETEMTIATALSTALQEYEVYFGFGDNQAAGDMTDGVYFRYDRAVLGTNWWACTASGGVRTTADTGIAAGLAWRKFKIIVNATGTSAAFYIDGTLVATIATNIPVTPNVTGAVLKQAKTVGVGARWTYYDWVWLHVDLTVSR